MKLSDAAVLVSGAAGHVGRGLIRDLAPHCARTVAVDRTPIEMEADTDQPIESHVCDLTDHDAVERTVTAIDGTEPPISVLLNCAGLIHSEPLVNLLAKDRRHHDPDTWRTTIAANLDTTFLLGACVAEKMVAGRTRGVIINISSVAAAGNAGQSAYSAAKAGVEALTVTWGKELGPLGIRTVAVAPAFLDTPSTHEAMSAKHVDDWIGRTPLRRLGSLDDLAGAVRFAIENDYLTGRVIGLDGGVRI